jgi:hypothetical protein
MLGIWSEDYENHSEKIAPFPFSETTYEECILSVECSWYVFNRMVTGAYQGQEDFRIQKWTQTLHIAFENTSDPRQKELIKNYVKSVADYLPLSINWDVEKFNYLMFLSKNRARDILVEHRDYFFGNYGEEYSRILADGVVLAGFCSLRTVGDEESIQVATAFIWPTNLKCSKELFIQSLGLQELSGLVLISETSEDINNIRLFILSILYNPVINHGQKVGSVKEVFSDIHAMALEEWKNRKGNN